MASVNRVPRAVCPYNEAMRWVMALAMALAMALVTAAGLAAQSGNPSRRLEAAREKRQRGAPAEAAKEYEALLPELRAAGDGKQLAAAVLEAGQAALAAGDYGRALERGAEAGTLFHGLEDEANEALAFNLTGSARVYRGEYLEAIAEYRRALELDRKRHDARGEINRLNNIAGAYFFLGRYVDALEGYQTVLRRAEENAGEAWGANRRQMALTNLAVLYEQLGQNGKALEYYREALRGGSALQPAEHGQLLSNAGTLYRRLGDAVKALEAYREAQKLFAREHLSDGEIHVLQNVGIALALDLRDARGAEEAFTAALVKAEATANRREIVLAHLFRGEAYLRAEQWSGALADFTQASEGARSLGGSEEEWTALYGLARVQRHAGRAGEALETLRGAIGVIEAVRTKLGGSSLKAEFLANKRDVYDAAIGLTLEAGTVDAEALFPLFEQARARNLQDALRGAAPGDGTVLTLGAVQARLGGRTLLEYWTGDGKVAQIRVSGGEREVWWRAWSRADEASVQAFAAALGSGDGAWRGQAEQLGGKLAGSAIGKARTGEVILVPDGSLAQLPFEALAGSGEGLWIERAAISYLPSAALLLRAERARSYRAPWQRQCAGFGDPVPGAQAPIAGDERWARLPQTAKELEWIARALPGRVTLHTGERDWKRFLFAEESGAPLLHFATHAVADAADPNRSRMLFTPEAGNPGSEYLFRAELERLRLDGTELVTLSACDTEAGKLVRGEGVQSFSRAFLAAGASSTVTTLWRVEDSATADFMRSFYRQLAGGKSKAEALRAVKLEFLRAGGVRAHPAYWAAFVLNGDGHSPIGPVFAWTWIAAVAAGLAAGLAAAYRYRRNRWARARGLHDAEAGTARRSE